MARRNDPPVINAASCLTIIVFGMMVFVGLFFFFVVRPTDQETLPLQSSEKALMTVIPAPTLTPTVYATKEPQTLEIHYVSEDGLSVGTVAEVYDTGGTGLSVRPQPGTGGYLNFVAPEGERFIIVDGPDAVGALAVDELGLGKEALAGHAVIALVFALVDIALIVELFEDLLDLFFVIGIGRTDEFVIRYV